ncbi:MAG: flagellar hook-length control protein FliK, partial [Oscillospiraceae bacterium]|nr:flagellar hook-length control protein FliK [Oscillospiraceae bacterium]
TPEIRVEAEPETGKPKQEEPIPEKPETKLAENNPEKQPELKQPAAEANEPVTFEQVKAAAEQNKTVGTYAAQNAETEAAQQATKQETTANAEVSSGENPGEVTARTPSIRTSEQQGNEQNKFGAPQHGDLSPLENENDTSKVKGQKEATYSETAEAVRDNAEKTLDSTSSAPPLAGGIKPEQYVASQQMKQIAQDAPVKSENLFDEMVLRLESMKTDSQSSMTIHLKPAYLGRVALELVMDAAGLHVKISAEDSGVRTMINGQITALMESLSNKGIEVAAVEVAYTGVDNGAFKENREDGSRQDNKRRYRREINRAESVNSYTVRQFDASDYYLETGVSSVQYSA